MPRNNQLSNRPNNMTTAKRRLTGTIVSDKMDKTVVVTVETVTQHPIYRKKYSVHKKYKAHDPQNEFHSGDVVIIEEMRPLSRDKRWRVVAKVK